MTLLLLALARAEIGDALARVRSLKNLRVRVEQPNAQVFWDRGTELVSVGSGTGFFGAGPQTRQHTIWLTGLDPTRQGSRAQVGDGALKLVIRAPHFQELKVDEPFELERIDEQGNYFYPPPGQPALSLTPASPVGWAIKYPVALGVSGAGLAALLVSTALVFSKARRETARRRLLEERVAKATSPDALTNTLLAGQYRILSRLGAGGMATVYEGVLERDPTQSVAIKIMQPELAESKEFRARFQREFRLAARLVHPSIVKVIESGDQDGLYYIVMEFVAGRTLKTVLEERPARPLSETLALFRPILDAVHYAHQQQVVHRDLKTENVMVLASGKVKVMDFGLARTYDGTKITQTGTAMGTPAYMAPEQIMTGLTDARSDQYSLGVMLFEMVTDRKPFDAPEVMALAMRHLTDPVPSPRDFRPDLPLGVERVIMKMLAKDSAQRYPDLVAVLQALERAMQGDQLDQDVVTASGPLMKAQIPLPTPPSDDTTIGIARPNSGDDDTIGFQAP